MASIFLSHNGKDEQIAERLRNQLEQMGSKVYMFEHDQQPGRDITDKLTKAIDSCEVLFALFTKQGGHSKSGRFQPKVWPDFRVIRTPIPSQQARSACLMGYIGLSSGCLEQGWTKTLSNRPVKPCASARGIEGPLLSGPFASL